MADQSFFIFHNNRLHFTIVIIHEFMYKPTIMNFVQQAFFRLNMVHHFIKCPLWEHHKSITYINLVISKMVYDLKTSFATKFYKFF